MSAIRPRIHGSAPRAVMLGIAVLVISPWMAAADSHLAAPSLPTYCDELPDTLRSWFEANAAIFRDNLDKAHRPRSAEVCYRNGIIVVLAVWDIAGDTVQKDEDMWTSEFYVYYPTVNKILLFMSTPYDYLTSVMANYWQRSVEYPLKTVWGVELRGSGSELLRTAFFDQRGDLVSTGEIIVSVDGYEPQSFKAQRSGKADVLTAPRAPGGELTREGLVYKFFGLLDAGR